MQHHDHAFRVIEAADTTFASTDLCTSRTATACGVGSVSVISDTSDDPVAPADSEVVYTPSGEVRDGTRSTLTWIM